MQRNPEIRNRAIEAFQDAPIVSRHLGVTDLVEAYERGTEDLEIVKLREENDEMRQILHVVSMLFATDDPVDADTRRCLSERIAALVGAR